MNFLKKLSFLMLSIALGYGVQSAQCMQASTNEHVNGNGMQGVRVSAQKRERDADVSMSPERRLTPVKRLIMLFVAQARTNEQLLRERCEIIRQYIKDENAMPFMVQPLEIAKIATSSGLVLAQEGLVKSKQFASWVRSFYRTTEPQVQVTPLSDDQRATIIAQNLAAARDCLIRETRQLLFAASLDCNQLAELCRILGISCDDFKKALEAQGAYA